MLRRNIPGRYNTWASDDDDTRGESDEEASVPDDPEPEPEEARAVPEALVRGGREPARDGRVRIILHITSAPRSRAAA